MKYWVRLEILKKIRFPARPSAVPANFKKYWELLLTLFYVKKPRNIKKKSNEKTEISGIFPAFSDGKKFFLKIGLGHVWAIDLRIYEQTISKNK